MKLKFWVHTLLNFFVMIIPGESLSFDTILQYTYNLLQFICSAVVLFYCCS